MRAKLLCGARLDLLFMLLFPGAFVGSISKGEAEETESVVCKKCPLGTANARGFLFFFFCCLSACVLETMEWLHY